MAVTWSGRRIEALSWSRARLGAVSQIAGRWGPRSGQMKGQALAFDRSHYPMLHPNLHLGSRRSPVEIEEHLGWAKGDCPRMIFRDNNEKLVSYICSRLNARG